MKILTESINFEEKRLSIVRTDLNSRKTIVFLHNGGGDRTIWKKQIEYFSKRDTVYALDFIGHGTSSKDPESLSLDACVKMLETVINKYQIERPILVGNCIGASTAIEYAINNAANVERLILFNICGGVPMFQHQFYFTFTPWGTPWGNMFYKCLFGLVNRFEFLIQLILKQSFSPKTTSDNFLYQYFRSKIQEPWQHSTRFALLKSFQSFNKFYNGFKLPENFPKHTIIWGRDNQALSLKDGRHLEQWFRADEFIEIENCGHFPMAENPKEINELIEKKLNFL